MRKITPKQWDSLTAKSGRQVVRCYANVLKNGAAAGRVPCGGTVALDTFEEIERTASLSIPQELDWLAVELQPVMEIDGEEYPLGVFLPARKKRWTKPGIPFGRWNVTTGRWFYQRTGLQRIPPFMQGQSTLL